MSRSPSILAGLLVASLVELASLSPACQAADLAKSAHNVRQVIAHRGACAERPENTLASARRAIEVGATAIEVDVRTTQDGHLALLHDAILDRTTDGKGPLSEITLARLMMLDAGSHFDPRYRGERVALLEEVLAECKGKIDVLLDLKESGDAYLQKVVAMVRTKGDPRRTIVGVRSVEQARDFRRLLPEARQLGLIAKPDEIESYAQAGVDMIRLWPRWLTDSSLIERVRKSGAKLHLNGTTGIREETISLLAHSPDSLSSDDPRQLVATLAELRAEGATAKGRDSKP